jgi:uncharacterized protein (UPF0332 family)
MSKCLEQSEDERPGAVRIETPAERKQEAERCWNQANFHQTAAVDNLTGAAKLMAIRQGYYVMLHKSNQALALAGFSPKNHRCTLLGIRGVFDAPELADSLRRASKERNNVDYGMNPHDPQLKEFDAPQNFLADTVEPFVFSVDDAIRDELGADEWNSGPSFDV